MMKETCISVVTAGLLSLATSAIAQQPVQTPGTTTTQTTTITQTAPLSNKEMKQQHKQQKQQEKALNQSAKAQKDQANALKHQDKATNAQEKANAMTGVPVSTPPPATVPQL